jgi:hypothetical protein
MLSRSYESILKLGTNLPPKVLTFSLMEEEEDPFSIPKNLAFKEHITTHPHDLKGCNLRENVPLNGFFDSKHYQTQGHENTHGHPSNSLQTPHLHYLHH